MQPQRGINDDDILQAAFHTTINLAISKQPQHARAILAARRDNNRYTPMKESPRNMCYVNGAGYHAGRRRRSTGAFAVALHHDS